PFSKMSTDLHEFPTDVKRTNYRASGLGILDLKSYALGALITELGLTSPERYVFCLRRVVVSVTPPLLAEADVIMRNFDPVTLQPSKYVNDTLFTYNIIPTGVVAQPRIYDVNRAVVDPSAPFLTTVASTYDFWQAAQPPLFY